MLAATRSHASATSTPTPDSNAHHAQARVTHRSRALTPAIIPVGSRDVFADTNPSARCRGR